MTRRKHSATARDRQPPPDSNRRDLFNHLWLGLIGVAMAETVWLVSAFLRSAPTGGKSTPDETIIDAGPASRFTPGTVTAFPRGRFYLACLEDGGFLALSRRCTHLGCTVPWDDQTKRFACPCHASAFDIRGAVIQSPAPRPLDHFAVTIKNDRINVDISRAIRRTAVRPDEVVYA